VVTDYLSAKSLRPGSTVFILCLNHRTLSRLFPFDYHDDHLFVYNEDGKSSIFVYTFEIHTAVMSKNTGHKSALSVSRGVTQPPAVNPNLKKIRRHLLSADEYIKGILAGDRTLLSKSITIIESNLSEHNELARQIITGCLPHAGNSLRIGITGVPGVGKSSFIEALGAYLTARGSRLAVLAIDPSSERSKGSILGDKTRMETLAAHSNAFIRPSPSAGTLGGVARKTRESTILCEAAGFNIIFIETVGVGQSETAVHSMVDFFLLLMLAGAGDELQGIKKGIMEMADMLVITKADGSNIENAGRAAAEYTSALHLFPVPESKWMPRVLTCSARKNTGISEIWEQITEYRNHVTQNGYLHSNRRNQSLYWMNESIEEALKLNFYSNEVIRSRLNELKERVLQDKISSFGAAQQILRYYFKKDL
jgi:LAO/AO transport system kinase